MSSMNGIFEKISRPGFYLLAGCVALVFFLILFSNLDLLPLKNPADFLFLAFIFLAFALYRPGWAFLFFVGTIALENIRLAPENLAISVKPYQFIGALALAAVLIKSLFKKLGFHLPKLNKFDLLPLIFAISGFISALASPVSKLALKQSVVALSFVALYFLARIFVQNISDLKKIIPFFLGSSAVVVFYGIWQNIAFQNGWTHFEVMPGRPNSTFAEADWYGIFLVFLLSVLYSLIYREHIPEIDSLKSASQITDRKLLTVGCWLLITFTFISLILTVSRSAWLGAFTTTFVFLFFILTNLKINPRKWNFRQFFPILRNLAVAIICSLAVIHISNLTAFQLGNRAQSAGTGLQKITAACEKDIILPEKITSSEELIRYGCRHINLEEIKPEKMRGSFIKEVYRIDPNINIRAEIYRKSWETIRRNPGWGIGWGNAAKILGADERGTPLNSSNIFLEVWLGAGIPGVFSFIFIWINVTIKALGLFSGVDRENKIFGLFLFLGSAAVVVPNLFNAGIFLGFLWLFLGIAFLNKNENRH